MWVQGPESDTCSYSHLRLSGSCKDHWNAADHIILILTHHMTVTGYELTSIFSSNRKESVDGMDILAIAVTAFFWTGIFRSARKTASLFHTPAESLAGISLGIAISIQWLFLVPRITGAIKRCLVPAVPVRTISLLLAVLVLIGLVNALPE